MGQRSVPPTPPWRRQSGCSNQGPARAATTMRFSSRKLLAFAAAAAVFAVPLPGLSAAVPPRPPPLPPSVAPAPAAAAAAARPWRPAIIAHRGGSGVAPEESMRAYELAVADGADFLECDVSVTADEQLVCSHEPALSFLTTDVEEKRHRSAFPLKKKKVDYVVDRVARRGCAANDSEAVTGWMIADFPLAKVETVFLRQRYADREHDLDGKEHPLPLADLVDFAKEKGVGLYLEPKHSPYLLAQKGFESVQLIVKLLVEKKVLKWVDKNGTRPATVADAHPAPELEAYNLDGESYGGGTAFSAPALARAARLVFDARKAVYSRVKRRRRVERGPAHLPLVLESFTYNDLVEAMYIGLTDDGFRPETEVLGPVAAGATLAAAPATGVALVYDALQGVSPLGDLHFFVEKTWKNSRNHTAVAGPVVPPAARADGVSVLAIDKRMALKKGFVAAVHRAGFRAHAWTFRNEPSGLVTNAARKKIVSDSRNIPLRFAQDPYQELLYFFAEGVDGCFTDFPGTMARAVEFAQATGRLPSNKVAVSVDGQRQELEALTFVGEATGRVHETGPAFE